MNIENKFDIRQVVYHVVDSEQVAWIITGIIITENDTISYNVSNGTSSANFYEYELSSQKTYSTMN